MAGDWIKIEHTMPDKPEVIRLAEILDIDQDAVAGKLTRIWIWADQQTMDGNAIYVTKAFLDRYARVSGMADALLQVGWLRDEGGTLSFPNFDQHNGQTAKSRAATNRRVSLHRKGHGAKTGEIDGVNVTQRKQECNAHTVTQALQKPLPEKRREEKILSHDQDHEIKAQAPGDLISTEPLPFSSPEFADALKDYESHRKEIRKPIKPTGRKELLADLAKMGESAAIAAMRKSIKNGWQGVFPEQPNRNSADSRRAERAAKEFPHASRPLPRL